MGLMQLWAQSDTVGKLVALLLLAMSLASWVVIIWKSRLLYRVVGDVARSIAGFWSAANADEALRAVQLSDRDGTVLPLVQSPDALRPHTMSASGDRSQQLTRVLREALHRILAKLQYGQVLLATIGATAPFVGLLGTVWGIYTALVSLGSGGQVTIDRIAQPVGEALIMTAFGLAVAIPAVLAFNVFGKKVNALEADLEGFARDLRELWSHDPAAKQD
jgi:biopolymer transport protein ExbB